MNHAAAEPKRAPKLVLAMMACTMLCAVPLVDWNGTGNAKPLWMFFLPLAFGITAAAIAARQRRLGWALGSLALGVFSVQGLGIVVTLIAGP